MIRKEFEEKILNQIAFIKNIGDYQDYIVIVVNGVDCTLTLKLES